MQWIFFLLLFKKKLNILNSWGTYPIQFQDVINKCKETSWGNAEVIFSNAVLGMGNNAHALILILWLTVNETYERDLVKREEFYHLKEVIFGMDSS